jgi:hypothetical protein
MAYVIEYTITAGGRPYIGHGTSHMEALYRFIEDPPSHYGWHPGQYAVTDGEEIHFTGPTQKDFADREYYRSAFRRAEQAVLEATTPLPGRAGGKGSRDARKRLEGMRNTREPAAASVTITFVMEARTVFDAVSPKVRAHRQRQPDVEAAVRKVAAKGQIRLLVNAERQTPSEELLRGVPDDIGARGVRMHGKLIPWDDIDGAEAYVEEVAA